MAPTLRFNAMSFRMPSRLSHKGLAVPHTYTPSFDLPKDIFLSPASPLAYHIGPAWTLVLLALASPIP